MPILGLDSMDYNSQSMERRNLTMIYENTKNIDEVLSILGYSFVTTTSSYIRVTYNSGQVLGTRTYSF